MSAPIRAFVTVFRRSPKTTDQWVVVSDVVWRLVVEPIVLQYPKYFETRVHEGQTQIRATETGEAFCDGVQVPPDS